jgi:hypothetical protein
MTKVRLSSKLIPVLLLVAIFCSACDVPDISEFTKQSAEMTRGIRKGVKDTENLIRAASERDDLYSDKDRIELEKQLKAYQKALKPTVAALDGLDTYLEALNALAQANKKSGENASGVVTAVSSLVTAVSGLTFASSAVNVATGLLTLAEQFRTTKDFRRRVTLAAEIVEGVHPKVDKDGRPIKDENRQVIFERACTGDAADQIVIEATSIRDIIDPIMAGLTAAEVKTLKPLTPEEKRTQLNRWGKLSNADLVKITMAEYAIAKYGCGVVDFIKFNLRELKDINLNISQNMYTNAREKNRVVLGFYESIAANDRKIQNELERILNFKALVPVINQYVMNGADSRAVATKITLKQTLDSIFSLDPEIETAVMRKIQDCPDCGAMLTVLRTPSGRACNAACRTTLTTTLQLMSRPQFNKSVSLIEAILDGKAVSLFDQNRRYLADLERIKPSYDVVSAELNAMKEKQNQLDTLLDTSLTALDAWTESHANLRVAVNTKKPLTVSKLASKVREIWVIINPESK